MNHRMIMYLYGMILGIEALLLVFPLIVSITYGESLFPFLITIGILLVFSIPSIIFKPKDTRIYAKEGYLTVAGGWILMSVFGALPFVLSGAIPNFVDALFETISGFTTTGSSILTAIEGLPMGILFWRSFTHWIGGMGVLVFVLAIMPSKDGHSVHLMRAEVPGPTKGKLVPKTRQTAIILYGIYLGITLLEVLFLLVVGKQSLYDALVTTFSTVGTGGFSVKNASIAGYNSPTVEWIVAVFMMLSGINYNLYFFILTKKFLSIFKSEEFRVYIIVVLGSTGIIVMNTLSSFTGISECIRASFFQVTSIISTTGFGTADFTDWPALSQGILIALMFLGACAGSTAGGLKVSRVLLLFKSFKREIKNMIHPKSVNVIRMDGEVVPDEDVKRANTYLVLYFVILILSFIVVTVDNFSFEVSFSAVITCFNNVGPGLGKLIGPSGNFSSFSWFTKLILSLDMLFGRLEIYPMIAFFTPATWKRRS